MADLTADLAPKIVEACTVNAEEAAGALGRALDGEFVVKPGEAKPRAELAEEALAGGGLVVTLEVGETSALVALPASSGLVPDWVKEPDPTGESKLSTLGQELSMLLLPDDVVTDDFQAAWADDLAAAVERTEPSYGAVGLGIELARGETLGLMTLLWPVAKVKAAIPDPEADAGEASEGGEAIGEPASESEPAPASAPAGKRGWIGPPPRDYRDLPPNVVSHLQVMVPVSASLAERKMSVEDVVEIGPGSIITFDKACDDPLEICVGERAIARGAAVKVGEKFGVRVQEMILPDEHFRPMLPNRSAS